MATSLASIMTMDKSVLKDAVAYDLFSITFVFLLLRWALLGGSSGLSVLPGKKGRAAWEGQ